MVSPLDWGLGHATRCVPVIRELIRQQAKVIIAADGRPLVFLKREFPGLEFITLPGYRFSYPASGNMVFKMAAQSPAIFRGIRKEHQALEKIVQTQQIDTVISDNRYGLWNKNIPCIFLTHQLKIKTPASLSFLQPLLFRLNMHYIQRFSECWIPDFADEPNLSGELSHIHPQIPNTFFIGPLSRFSDLTIPDEKMEEYNQTKYDLLIMLSGPEPQRTILEEKLLVQLKKEDYSTLILSGKPEVTEIKNPADHIRILPHLDSESLVSAMRNAGMIISRPGYSTLMDLAVLGKKAIFIPTPGQTEQEYLADYCSRKKWFYSMDQNQIDIVEAIDKSKDFTGIRREFDPSALKERIEALLKSI